MGEPTGEVGISVAGLGAKRTERVVPAIGLVLMALEVGLVVGLAGRGVLRGVSEIVRFEVEGRGWIKVVSILQTGGVERANFEVGSLRRHSVVNWARLDLLVEDRAAQRTRKRNAVRLRGEISFAQPGLKNEAHSLLQIGRAHV